MLTWRCAMTCLCFISYPKSFFVWYQYTFALLSKLIFFTSLWLSLVVNSWHNLAFQASLACVCITSIVSWERKREREYFRMCPRTRVCTCDRRFGSRRRQGKLSWGNHAESCQNHQDDKHQELHSAAQTQFAMQGFCSYHKQSSEWASKKKKSLN